MLQKIKDLAQACSGKDVELDILQKQLAHFGEYVQSVVTMEYMMPIIQVKFEGEEFRNTVAEYDRQRKIRHDAVIDACSILNRLSDKVGLDPFYSGSKDRHEIAEFTGKLVNELYYRGIHRGKNFDELVTTIKEENAMVPPCPNIKEELEL